MKINRKKQFVPKTSKISKNNSFKFKNVMLYYGISFQSTARFFVTSNEFVNV